MISEQAAREVLDQIKDSGSDTSVIELGWVDKIRVNQSRIVLRLNLPSFASSQRDRLAKEIRDSLKNLQGVEEVQIEVGNPSSEAEIGQAGHGQVAPLQSIPGVRKVIAVSSGKGGVGKSTVAVNIACALAQQGLKVGLLDADIYGPNIPIMLGVSDRTPEVINSGSDQQIIPIETCGIGMVSMGLLIEEHQPVIWRGPMLNGIIRQFLYQVAWGDKDVLIVDLPPGTGDAQLSLAQAVPMAGVIIVTTPQKVSLQDARRGLAMFRQMNVRVIGVVENMSVFIPPDRPDFSYELFGSGGGEQLSKENSVPLLAQIPMELNTKEIDTESLPIVNSFSASLSAKVFNKLAEDILGIVDDNC